VNSAPLPVPIVPTTITGLSPSPFFNVIPQSAAAAGMIAGITQINVQLPPSLTITDGTTPIGINSNNSTLYVTK